ncbi:GNAT family N-acetyltransferase [Heyndrickxia sp. FSL W8-0496]|uniref:GNAT family N-acetyltransferase n=1 Tax=Heyndrickxia TaxID=2837504 RepID=UPI0030F95566
MDITIEKLKDEDAKKLYEFELDNRGFFEKMVPSRGEDYYNFENFKIRHKELLDEQALGLSYFYLIKNKKGSILGRMNLVDIDKVKQLGHIGYRVAEECSGKGVASIALKLLLESIDTKGIKKLLAKTTDINVASQKVLEKNGFKFIETSDEEFTFNGQRVKFLFYMWTM